MKHSGLFVLSLVAAAVTIAGAGAWAQDASDSSRPATRLQAERDAGTVDTDALPMRVSRETMIVNKVHDLLDEVIAVDDLPGETVWESEPFGTSQYNRIGIRADVESEGGTISCSTWWQFTREDTFLPGEPSTFDAFQYLGDDGSMEEPDGVIDLYVAYPRVAFTGVSGLRAKVVCQTGRGGRRQYYPGGVVDPTPVTGTISDVKVLLRRE